jgi:hypothetical protein
MPEVSSEPQRWIASLETISADVQRVRIRDSSGTAAILSWSEVLSLWSCSPFAAFFSTLLQQSPFAAFYWECAPVSTANAESTAFEYVTVRAHAFAPASPHDFAEHLDRCPKDVAAKSFANLGGDAVLVSPCDRGPADYSHLAAFSRSASMPQQAAFWAAVATALEGALQTRSQSQPTWVSTEGSGVPWLHVRLDSRPKYYHYPPYRQSSA